MSQTDSLFDRVLLLKGVPFFELLRTDQLRYLASALEPVAWVAGHQIFERGEPVDCMYIIVSGRIGISMHNAPGAQDFIAQLERGECFGEMGLLDDLPRSASANVLVNTEAYSLPKEKMRGLLSSYPEMGLGMLRAMSRRLREANLSLMRCQAQLGEKK